MATNDWVYLFALSAAITASYFPIAYFLHYFFHSHSPKNLANNALASCLAILSFSLGIYAISFYIPNIETGNRIIHAFGGGFLAYMVCFLAAFNTSLQAPKLKFIVFSFMLVMTLGVFNEVVEYFMQNYFHFTAAPHINDTWLDLISNIVGTLFAIICFTPFMKR